MNSPAILRSSFPLPSPSVTPASQLSNFRHALLPSDRLTLIAQDQQWINQKRKPPKRGQRRLMSAVKGRAPPIRSAATKTDSLPTMLGIQEKTKPNVSETLKPKRKVADIWREIQGANNWEGLLDPMDDILRKEIIRYGEFSQACYDGFDFDPFSKYCGSCKYDRSQLFQGVGMPDYGYEVTKYLYATSNINLPSLFQKPRVQKLWSTHANWMGFIAVTTDEKEIKRLGRRDIVIAWRGTVTNLEWIADLMDYLRPAELNNLHPHPDVKVEAGFLNLYTAKEPDCRFSKSSARDQVLSELKRLIQKYRVEKLSITITGHSLGSALAMLSAYDIAEMGLNRLESDNQAEPIPITVFSFAGPRVGNVAFKDRCEELGLKFLRVVNVHDSVPKVPGVLFNEKFQMMKQWIDKIPWSYYHVGVELALDHTHSPFLRPTNDAGCFHNLEAHLHLLDGYHGRGQRFYLSSRRDPALVNKSCDFLKEHHLVPPFWWQDANRGLIQNSEGRSNPRGSESLKSPMQIRRYSELAKRGKRLQKLRPRKEAQCQWVWQVGDGWHQQSYICEKKIENGARTGHGEKGIHGREEEFLSSDSFLR